MFDPRRTDDQLRDWVDWSVIAVATCMAAASVALRLWLGALAMVILAVDAARRLRRRRALRSDATPEP